MRRQRTRLKTGYLILILSRVLQTQAQECGKPVPPLCSDDCTGKMWYLVSNTGSADTCHPCPECVPGFKLVGMCGGSVGVNASCEPQCPEGEYFDQERGVCNLCKICEHTVNDMLCNATHDTVCGPCKSGFYHLKNHPDLCNPCEFHPEQEKEPQCQKKEASTTITFLDNLRTDNSPMKNQQVTLLPNTHVDTVTTDKTKDEKMTSVDQTYKGSPEEGSTAESSIFGSASEDVLPDQVHETGSTWNAGLQIASVCILPIVLLVMIFIRMRRKQESHRDYMLRRLEPPDDDVSSDGEKVSLKMSNGTAHFRPAETTTISSQAPTSGTPPPVDFPTTPSHLNLTRASSLESVIPVHNGRGSCLSDGYQRRITTCSPKHMEINPLYDRMSTSVDNLTLNNEPDEFAIKPIKQKEPTTRSADVLQPLISQQKDVINYQKNHYDPPEKRKSFVTVAVQCPSIQDLSPDNGASVGDSDRSEKVRKQCTAEPEDHGRSAPISAAIDNANIPVVAEPGTAHCKQTGTQTIASTSQQQVVINCSGKKNKIIYVSGNSKCTTGYNSSDSDDMD